MTRAAKPILFSGPMIRALLDGRKTQTRRVLKHPEDMLNAQRVEQTPRGPIAREYDRSWPIRTGYAPGDLLYVRESFGSVELEGGGIGNYYIVYDADEWSREHKGKRCGMPQPKEWRPSPLPCKLYPSIHMPRWASRLTLEVTDVRVQRVAEISEEDARAEGVLYVPGHGDITLDELRADPGYSVYLCCRHGFELLWNDLNAKRGYGWDVNPWVCALTFKVHRCNVDQLTEQAA